MKITSLLLAFLSSTFLLAADPTFVAATPTPDPACDKDDTSNLALVETPNRGSWCR